MNTKVIAILGTGALVVIAGVVVIEMGRARSESSAESSSAARPALFPDLAARVNDVAEIDVARNGSSFTIRHGANGWELADRGGYPVPFEKVKQVAVGLSQLRIVEEKTSHPDKYKAIGVQDPDPKPAGEPEGFGGPSLVTLKDGKGAVLASAIVGNQRSASGVYVRRAGETQSYAAEGAVEVPGSVTAWVDPKILEVPGARVKSVSIHQPGGEVVQLSKATPEQPNFSVADVPPGKELKGPSAGDAAGNALAYMSFEDVAPAGTIDFSGKDEKVKPGATAEYRTFDGEVFTIQTAEKDGKTWMQIAAAFDPAANPPAAEGQTPPAPRPGQKTPEEAKKEAEEISARLSRWVFAVPSYKASLFATKMADLLKEPQPAPGAEGQPGAIPPPSSMQPPVSVPPAPPPASPPASTPPAPSPPPPGGEEPAPATPPAEPAPAPATPPAAPPANPGA